MPGCFSILEQFVGGESRIRKTKTIWNANSFIWGFFTGFALLPGSSWLIFLTLFCLHDFVWGEGMEKTVNPEPYLKLAVGWWGNGGSSPAQGSCLSFTTQGRASRHTLHGAVLILIKVRRFPFPQGSQSFAISQSFHYPLDKLCHKLDRTS